MLDIARTIKLTLTKCNLFDRCINPPLNVSSKEFFVYCFVLNGVKQCERLLGVKREIKNKSNLKRKEKYVGYFGLHPDVGGGG